MSFIARLLNLAASPCSVLKWWKKWPTCCVLTRSTLPWILRYDISYSSVQSRILSSFLSFVCCDALLKSFYFRKVHSQCPWAFCNYSPRKIGCMATYTWLYNRHLCCDTSTLILSYSMSVPTRMYSMWLCYIRSMPTSIYSMWL